MQPRITHTIGELAKLAKVSIRTLHHYDALGLLKPEAVGANGYRYYGRREMLRLQEILFYREMGLSLSEIGALLDQPEDMAARLRRHRRRLAEEAQRRAAMIAALDRTLLELEGKTMTNDDLYAPFSPEKQGEYEAWLVETYGTEMAEAIQRSKAVLEDAPEGAMAERMDELRAAEAELVAAYEHGADPAPALARHRAFVGSMWGRDCSPEAYVGLADLYLSHPDFIARYERLSPGFSQWLPRAMKQTGEDR